MVCRNPGFKEKFTFEDTTPNRKMSKGSNRVFITFCITILLVCFVTGKLFNLLLFVLGLCLISRLICSKKKEQTTSKPGNPMVVDIKESIKQSGSNCAFDSTKPISAKNRPVELTQMYGRVKKALKARHQCEDTMVTFNFAKEVHLIDHNDNYRSFEFQGLILPKIYWAYKNRFGLEDYNPDHKLDIRDVFEPLHSTKEKEAFKNFMFNFYR